MVSAKQVADLITGARAFLGLFLVWLGWSQGEAAFVLVAWLMLVDWIGDFLDGAFARQNKVIVHTWIGDHDLEVDMLVSFGLLIYLLSAGFVGWTLVVGYLLLWAVIFWRLGMQPSLGMLFQAPIYALFIWKTFLLAPQVGWSILIWLLVVIVISWPRFPEQVIPGFLKGILESMRGENGKL